jgi:hypothetical protein
MSKEEAKRGFTRGGERPRGRLLLATAIVVLAGFATASPASAIPDLVRVEKSSEATSENKSVTVKCPKDKKTGQKQVTGPGATIKGAVGRVIITEIRPNPAPPPLTSTSVTATAVEDASTAPGPTAEKWSITAIAICAPPQPGLEVVESTGPKDTSDVKVARPVCPLGKRVLGTGGAINDGLGQVSLGATVPEDELREVDAFGFENDEFIPGLPDGPEWSVTGIAICASPPAGLHHVEAFALPTSDNKSLTAACASGFQAYGLAGGIRSPAGGVYPDGFFPSANLKEVTVSGAEQLGGYHGDWGLRADAICAV